MVFEDATCRWAAPSIAAPINADAPVSRLPSRIRPSTNRIAASARTAGAAGPDVRQGQGREREGAGGASWGVSKIATHVVANGFAAFPTAHHPPACLACPAFAAPSTVDSSNPAAAAEASRSVAGE